MSNQFTSLSEMESAIEEKLRLVQDTRKDLTDLINEYEVRVNLQRSTDES